jgi:hypothetical protein
MAVFVDLDDEVEPPNPQSHPYHRQIVPTKPVWQQPGADGDAAAAAVNGIAHGTEGDESKEVPKPRENVNRNAMTEALGCYP